MRIKIFIVTILMLVPATIYGQGHVPVVDDLEGIHTSASNEAWRSLMRDAHEGGNDKVLGIGIVFLLLGGVALGVTPMFDSVYMVGNVGAWITLPVGSCFVLSGIIMMAIDLARRARHKRWLRGPGRE
jgi:uncharacterized membrane protein HdeD (DUF308 family)